MSLRASKRIVATGLGLCFCLQAGVALAQTPPSLAEMAQKEQERRKALKGAVGRVYSDKDLPKAATPPIASTVPATPTVVQGENKPAESKADDQKDETWWRNRMLQAREAQRRAESFAAALQSQINGLTTDVVNRDDPYQRAKLADSRLKALSELQRVTGEIEQAKKDIVDIEEEARRANVPPGWLR